MKRLLLGSILLPLLGTSIVSHANPFDGRNSFGRQSQYDDYYGSDDDESDDFMNLRRSIQEGNSRYDSDFESNGSFVYQKPKPRVIQTPHAKPDKVPPTPFPHPLWRDSQVATTVSAASKLKSEGFYQVLGVSAVWTQNGQKTDLARQLRDVLLAADQDGLNVTEYWTDAHESLYQNLTADQAGTFENMLTDSYIKFATHLSVGRVSPKVAGDEVKVEGKSVKVDLLASVLKNTSTGLAGAIEVLRPQWKSYRDLRAALINLKSQDASIVFPEIVVPKKSPKLGAQGDVFAAIKRRLLTLGYPMADMSPVFTDGLQKMVRQYMADNNLSGAADLKTSSKFWPSISVSMSSRINQIGLTMEKIRWLKHQPEDRRIEVNLAFQRFRLYERGGLVMGFKTVNGRPDRMSPMLEDKLVNVELNPTWTVPASLVIKDKLPLIKQDLNYVYEHHFTVLDSSMQRRIDPDMINWSDVGAQDTDSFYLQQAPGLNNALGVMKFNLTNPYAIYLHDTNERDLFPNNYRQLSSGCIRLEKPVDLAAYLLKDDPKWGNLDYLKSQMAKTGWAEEMYPPVKAENFITLAQPMPIYLAYLSVEVDESGVIKFGGDYYGQDKRLFNALKAAGH